MSPVFVRKIRGKKNRCSVKDKSGKVHARNTTCKKAFAQKRILDALRHK